MHTRTYRARHFASILALLAVAWLEGCARGTPGQLPTAPVTGQVTYQGQPLTQGEVMFIPVETGPGVRAAYGKLDAQGQYRLTTYREGDGAILGQHRVAIVAREEVSPDMGKQISPEGILLPGRQPKSLIPERYADPATSGLSAQVKEGTNRFDFALTP